MSTSGQMVLSIAVLIANLLKHVSHYQNRKLREPGSLCDVIAQDYPTYTPQFQLAEVERQIKCPIWAVVKFPAIT